MNNLYTRVQRSCFVASEQTCIAAKRSERLLAAAARVVAARVELELLVAAAAAVVDRPPAFVERVFGGSDRVVGGEAGQRERGRGGRGRELHERRGRGAGALVFARVALEVRGLSEALAAHAAHVRALLLVDVSHVALQVRRDAERARAVAAAVRLLACVTQVRQFGSARVSPGHTGQLTNQLLPLYSYYCTAVPVCTRMWRVRFAERGKNLPQKRHA